MGWPRWRGFLRERLFKSGSFWSLCGTLGCQVPGESWPVQASPHPGELSQSKVVQTSIKTLCFIKAKCWYIIPFSVVPYRSPTPSAWATHSPSLYLITGHPPGTKTSCCRLCRRTLTWGLGLSWSMCGFSYSESSYVSKSQLTSYLGSFYEQGAWFEAANLPSHRLLWSLRTRRILLGKAKASGVLNVEINLIPRKEHSWDPFNWHDDPILNRVIRKYIFAII